MNSVKNILKVLDVLIKENCHQDKEKYEETSDVLDVLYKERNNFEFLIRVSDFNDVDLPGLHVIPDVCSVCYDTMTIGYLSLYREDIISLVETRNICENSKRDCICDECLKIMNETSNAQHIRMCPDEFISLVKKELQDILELKETMRDRVVSRESPNETSVVCGNCLMFLTRDKGCPILICPTCQSTICSFCWFTTPHVYEIHDCHKSKRISYYNVPPVFFPNKKINYDISKYK